MPELTLAEPAGVLIAATAAFVAGLIRGFAGFGGPAIMIVVLTQFYSPASVLPKVVLIDIVFNLRLLPTT